VDANGDMNYTLKGIHVKVTIIWNYDAPEGAGDMHTSVMRGTKANLVVRQGKAQGYKSTLYIEPVITSDLDNYEKSLKASVVSIRKKYPDIDLVRNDKGWEVVTKSRATKEEATLGKLPDWELPNMLAKYYTTTQGVGLALKNKN
jgi:hypothetical protein